MLGVLALLGVLGCQRRQPADIPNRVLDRPTDVALTCAEIVCIEDAEGNEVCTTQPLPLTSCGTEIGACGSDNPHLVGFVANSERNEIAMFTKCSNRLVDMDVNSPGYDFIPAGLLPTELDASQDGCWVVSANVGSCDLTELDAPGLARFGLGSAEELGRTDELDEPSSLVSTLIPRTLDLELMEFRPLGARPGHLLMVPSSLTQAPGLDPDHALQGLCDPLMQRSAYVSFPSCNLVAEVDLQTGYILQSRQFVSDGAGGVTVVDTGISPECPVECPAQFDGTLPDGSVSIDEDGPFVQALALSLPLREQDDEQDPNGESLVEKPDEADRSIEGQRIFVGGLGSDILFELPIDDSGVWSSSSYQLELLEAGGIKNIDVSPAVNAEIGADSFSQFIYVATGDGSTRVVGRGVPGDPTSVGVECETQPDPTLIAPGTDIAACIPVQISPYPGQPPERRGFSRGPGIRPGRGDEVTDWIFRKVYEGESGGGPFKQPATTAVGVTTGGFAIYVMIDAERANGSTTVGEVLQSQSADPNDIMDVRLFAHSLWPEPVDDPVFSLPLVQDASPTRAAPSSATNAIRELAPTLRRVDAAYLEHDSGLLNVGGNFDKLGGDENFYEEPVVRAVVHDYRSWANSGGPNWMLEWEGTIPNTQSGTGRIECDVPGWQGGTCLEGAALYDQGASFCDDGVLRGDKLVLVGCSDDTNCGEGRRCLRETAAGGKSSGICVSAVDYDARAAELRQVCDVFIGDPCGEAYREFTITKATQNTLWIEAMDQPLLSHVVDTPCPDTPNGVLIGDSCVCAPGWTLGECDPNHPYDSDAAPEQLAAGCCPDPSSPAYLDGQAPVLHVEDQYVCTEWQPDSDCVVDADCRCDITIDGEAGCDESSASALCIEGLCRRPCAEGEDCVLRRLPGPACFAEFVRYQVALRNAFRVSGPNIEFLSDRVEVDDAEECRPTSNPVLSQLLTSRLPLPTTDDPNDPEWLAIPVCDDDGLVEPGDPNPCRIVASRASENKYHVFQYAEQATISALRFSNPVFSIILDLTSLEALGREVSGHEDAWWPIDFAAFRRSRIPRGYRTAFGLGDGYVPFSDFLTLEGRPVTYPVRIVAGPQADVAYIVDGSGPGSTTSIRGQVVRVTLGEQVQSDESFKGVR